MKLLLFSDLHADRSAALRLVERARTADILVCAGDVGNARRQVGVCLDILKDSRKPAILVPGNAESAEELVEACRRWPEARVLHGAGTTLGGVTFYGLGGGVPVTPFGSWSYDFTESEAAALLADCPPGCVLVSHSPPKGTLDVSSRGQALGSEALRDAILRVGPSLVVCGHIHACAGQTALIGQTPVVNAGPDGIDWDLVARDEADRS
jgi:Icc-related predicted phosphoesterase